jgi:hypothetical protein
MKMKSKPSAMKSLSQDDKWQVENDLRTLQDAAKIMADPKRMAKCKAMAEEQQQGMKSMMKGM